MIQFQQYYKSVYYYKKQLYKINTSNICQIGIIYVTYIHIYNMYIIQYNNFHYYRIKMSLFSTYWKLFLNSENFKEISQCYAAY